MSLTSISMLQRLQQADDPDTWNRLVALYAPLLRSWLQKYDVQATDTDDLMQEVLMAVSSDLPTFEHSGRPGAFRAWLRSMMVNRLRNFWRARGRRPLARGGSDLEHRLSQLDDPASEMSQIWNQQHDLHVAKQLLEMTKPNFTDETWTAFSRVAIQGHRPGTVAEELGISVNAVFIAKSRVLSRLRQEAAGLVDSDSSFPAKS